MPAKKKRPHPVVEEVKEPEPQPKTPSPPPPSLEPDPPSESAPHQKAKEVIQELDQLNNGSTKQSKTNFKLVLIITILTAVIVGFVAGGVYVYFSGLSSVDQSEAAKPNIEATPSPNPTSTPFPTSKPDENLDVSLYKISVLNGSGKIGEAGKAADLLEAEGFEVANTANATSYDFEETAIQVTAEVPDNVVELIQKALSDYTTLLGDELDKDSNYDIIITVGSDLAE